MESPSIPPTPKLELYQFGENKFEKHLITSTSQIQQFLEQPYKFWLNIPALDNQQLLSELGNLFDIHHLTLEDIQNTGQRPQFEEFEDFIFFSAKMMYTKRELGELEAEHISFIMGKNYVLSFQENPIDVFDPIRTRLENPSGRMRKLGTDYFTYTLLDTIVDQYYKIIELIGDANESLEEQIVGSRKKVKLEELYRHRKSIQKIRKISWPMRELLSTWKKSDHHLIKKRNQVFINDVYEHVVEILENLELQRETITSLVEIYMTHLSIKQNEVMKTLTIIATIFIPLTFIAGVYGMNFTHMPELEWTYSYPVVWLIFVGTTLAMLVYFKKKGWF
jgi:magnesium transporter